MIESIANRLTAAMDRLMHRLYGWRWNPIHQSGALAAWLLLVLTVTGTYLLVFYRVGAPSTSVQRIAADPWLGSWIRSLHRYATAAFVIAAVLHALRLVGQSRAWGPRTRAWVSGLGLVGIGLACAWTGYVMAWDSFGQRLAIAGARLFDVLPVFSEPIGRIFAGDRPVPSVFFFLNLFLHIALPLAMGAGLWLHVSRIARPVLAPPRALRWGFTGALLAVSVLIPAPLGPAADALQLPTRTPVDLTTAWWLPLLEHTPPLGAWIAVVTFAIGLLAVPRLLHRERVGPWTPSVVDPRLCTGCDQCTQDCPWGAIQMVARDDNRPTLVALVDPALCVSCGICAASCAPMGVGPPSRTGRDQLAVARATLVPSLGSRAASPVAVICCTRTDAAQRAALQSEGALLHEVACVGAVHTSVVELLVRQGAAGVMLMGCPPRDCSAREGPKWLEQRVHHDREAELQERVDRRRVRIITAAVGEAAATLAAFRAFRDELRALEIPDAEATIDLRELCEPELDTQAVAP